MGWGISIGAPIFMSDDLTQTVLLFGALILACLMWGGTNRRNDDN